MSPSNSSYPIKSIKKSGFKNHFLLKKLLELPDKIPDEIYYRGEFPPEHFHILTIVGSRNISSYGKEVLEFLINGLVGQNICIVSGLAMGVDGEAHKLAIKNKIHTIAVPGGGIEEKAIYPKINKDLSDEILLSGGLLMNEFEPNFKATDWSFPARNRIMASISDAVLLIEASERSGTLITARLALDYNKDVLAVPGSIFSKNSWGTNNLISQGAIPITKPEEILEALGISVYKDEKNTAQKIQNNYSGSNFNSESKSKIEKILETDNLNLTDLEKKILNLLKEKMTKDKLLENLEEFDTGEILMSLTMLEMKGFVKEEVGIVRRTR
jgi:DNA processing protein